MDFGPVSNIQDVPRAVEAHVRKWISTYLAAAERAAGHAPTDLPFYARPNSYLKVNLLEGLPGEENSPTIIIVTRGGNGRPEKSRPAARIPYGASHSLPLDIGIAVFTASYDGDGAREVGGAYGWSIAMLMMQRRDLDGAMDGRIRVESWDDIRLDDVAGEEARTRAILRLEFTIRLNDYGDAGQGPTTPNPPSDPYAVPSDWPTVATVTSTLSKEDPT
jgi:hypothetical protein